MTRRSYHRRNKFDGPFAGRLIKMLESPAYRVLSLSGHRVLARIEIELKRHGGEDNGKLPITYEQLVEYGIHRHSIAPAIRECEMLGFLEVERGKAGNREYRAPSRYRLTYQPVGRAQPTHEWQRIQTLEDAEAIARAARKTPVGDSENQCRKAPVSGAGNHHRKPGFSVPDSVTTVPVPESVSTSRLSGPISTARQERAASERGTVVGYPSSEATGDGKGTRLTEEATAGLSRSNAAGKLMDVNGGGLQVAKLPWSTPTLTEDRQSSMLGTASAPDDLRRKAKGAAGDHPRDAGGMASDRTIAEEVEWTL
jgi:hypothetical protein